MKPMKSIVGVTAILGVAVLAAIAATWLPNKPYQRFQMLDGTIYSSLRWCYERIHYDPTPVDVAIVGPSTSVLGLSAPRMQQDLATLGKPVKVANFSVIADGRNVEWAIAHELLAAKRPRVIVVAIDRDPHPWGHDAFKYVAPASAIAFPPDPLLHNALYDVFFLPFRQMELFAAGLFPEIFGLATDFDPTRYARTPTDFSVSHRMEDGKWIDMNRRIPREVLLADYRRHLEHKKRTLLPRALSDAVEADNAVYIREIAREAAARGTKLVFVYLPIFNAPPGIRNEAFYRRYGPVEDNSDLASQDQLYQGWAHFNHAGAMVASDRVARGVAPLL